VNSRMVKREGSQSFEDVRQSFRWRLPPRYNLGVDVADHQPKHAVAIITTDGRHILRETTFGELSESSNRLANALAAHGVKQGDRVGIMLPQRPETAIAHIAVYNWAPSRYRFRPCSDLRQSRCDFATASPSQSSGTRTAWT
jgi:non-ribosomal peptide synthetase component F